MKATAKIIIHGEDLPWEMRRYTATWEGPRNGVVAFSTMLLKSRSSAIRRVDDTHLDAVGYPLRKVGEDDYGIEQYYARADRLYSLSWAWHFSRRLTSRFLGLVWARIILTLMVWNLAEVPANTVPTWECVRSHCRKQWQRSRIRKCFART